VTRDCVTNGIMFPVSSFQFPVSSFQFPVSSFQFPVSGFQKTANRELGLFVECSPLRTG